MLILRQCCVKSPLVVLAWFAVHLLAAQQLGQTHQNATGHKQTLPQSASLAKQTLLERQMALHGITINRLWLE